MQFVSVTIFFQEKIPWFFKIYFLKLFAPVPHRINTPKLSLISDGRQTNQVYPWKAGNILKKILFKKSYKKEQNKKSSPVNLFKMISMHHGKIYIECKQF